MNCIYRLKLLFQVDGWCVLSAPMLRAVQARSNSASPFWTERLEDCEILRCIRPFSEAKFPGDWSTDEIHRVCLMDSVVDHVFIYLAGPSEEGSASGWFYVYNVTTRSKGWIHPGTTARLRGIVHVNQTRNVPVPSRSAVNCNVHNARHPMYDIHKHIGSCVRVFRTLLVKSNTSPFWQVLKDACELLLTEEARVVLHCLGGRHRSLGVAWIIDTLCPLVRMTTFTSRRCEASPCCAVDLAVVRLRVILNEML